MGPISPTNIARVFIMTVAHLDLAARKPEEAQKGTKFQGPALLSRGEEGLDAESLETEPKDPITLHTLGVQGDWAWNPEVSNIMVRSSETTKKCYFTCVWAPGIPNLKQGWRPDPDPPAHLTAWTPRGGLGESSRTEAAGSLLVQCSSFFEFGRYYASRKATGMQCRVTLPEWWATLGVKWPSILGYLAFQAGYLVQSATRNYVERST